MCRESPPPAGSHQRLALALHTPRLLLNSSSDGREEGLHSHHISLPLSGAEGPPAPNLESLGLVREESRLGSGAWQEVTAPAQ